jgi:hypothetical protein
MTEGKKAAFMNDLKRTMSKIDGNMDFYKQFKVPPIGSLPTESKYPMTGFHGYGFNDHTRPQAAQKQVRHNNAKK